MTLNVLSITYEGYLSHPTNQNAFSDAEALAQARQLRLAKKLDNYVIITQRDAKSVPSSIRLAENMQVYPTRSTQKSLYIQQAYQLGVELARLNPFNCIATANTQKTGLVGYLLKRRFNIPLNVNLTADIVDNPHYISEKRVHLLYNLFTKWLLRRADTIRVSTQYEQDKLASYKTLPDIWRIPFVIDPSRYTSPKTKGWRMRVMGTDFDHIVLSVGRFISQNDPMTLLHAARTVVAQVPRTRFVFVGEGPLAEKVQRKIERFGIQRNVVLFGHVPADQIPALHNSADIFAMSALYEGSCMPLQEAAVCGKPMVTTDFAGARDLIANGDSGYIAPVGNSAQLAAHLLYLVTHKNQLTLMGQIAKQRALRALPKDGAVDLYWKMWQATANKAES